MENIEISRKRIIWIDALKGFVAILVIFGHAIGILPYALLSNASIESKTFLLNMENWIYSFHMMLFFMISGLVLYKAYFRPDTEKAKENQRFRLQLVNLVLLYILFSVIWWVLQLIFSESVVTPVTWRDLVLIPIAPVDALWYLWVLIVYYLIAYILYSANVERDAVCLLIVFCISLGSTLVSLPGILHNTVYYAIGFSLGIFIGKNGFALINNKLVKYITIFYTILATFLIFTIGWIPSEIPIVSVVTAIAFSITFFVLFMKIGERRPIRWLASLGQYALEIYLLGFIPSAIQIALLLVGVRDIVICTLFNTVVSISAIVFGSMILKKLNLHKLIFHPASWFHDRKIESIGSLEGKS